jgi:hypothetical protein
MNESININCMKQAYENRWRKTGIRTNGAEILTLMNKFLEITRKEWLIMNEARNIDLKDPAYENRWNKISRRPSGAEVIPMASKKNNEKITVEYLNEKLTYFYNNGGPVMDI